MSQQSIITIIIEDGSIVPGANSWVTREEFIIYTSSISEHLTDYTKIDETLIEAAKYINSLESNLLGNLVDKTQPMAFPRTGLYIENWNWSETEIPRQVLNAQLSLTLEMLEGHDPYKKSETQARTDTVEKGSVELRYTNPDAPAKVCKHRISTTHINLLLKNSGLKVV